ncbi:tetraspanin-10 [Ascaphus truei]|uniref:tetraspanin-10 n=1 Tax=Ascaphus truei TaxID=8439 RepID=UPI003F5A397D
MGGKLTKLSPKFLPFSGGEKQELDEFSSLLPKGPTGFHAGDSGSGGLPYYTQSCGAEMDSSLAPQSGPSKGSPPETYRPGLLILLIKYLMFFFNFIISALGFTIFSFGVWGLVSKQSLMSDRISHLGTDPMLLFVMVGLVVSVLAMSGCVGFLRENSCLLQLYSVGISLLLVMQLLSAIVLLTFRDQIRDSVEDSLMVAVKRYQDDSDLRFIMDEIQLGMECCGVQSFQDWTLSLYFNCSSPGVHACGVPFSCCIDPLENGTVTNSQCGLGALGMGEMAAGGLIHLGGCVPQLTRWLLRRTGDIGAGFLLLAGTEVACVLCARRVLCEIDTIKAKWYG